MKTIPVTWIGLLILMVNAAHAQVGDPPGDVEGVHEIAPGVGIVHYRPGVSNLGVIDIGGESLIVDGSSFLTSKQRALAFRQSVGSTPSYAFETDELAVGFRSGVERDTHVDDETITVFSPEGRGTRARGTTVWFADSIRLRDGSTAVDLIAIGPARHRAHGVVHVVDQGVLFVGDLCQDPMVGAFDQADLDAWIAALERLQGLGAKTVVPKRGKSGGPELLTRQKRWLLEVRDAVRAGIQEGKSYDDIRESIDLSWYQPKSGDADPARAILSVYRSVAGITPPWKLEELGLREGSSPTRNDSGWVAPRKVLVYRPSRQFLDRLSRVAPGVELVAIASQREALAQVADADAIIGMITPDLIRDGKKLRWVQAGSAGVERYVAMPGLRDSNITLTNAQRLYGPQIAEHTLGMLLALTRGLDRSIPVQREGRWSRGIFSDPEHPVVELRGKTLLVVGLGGIGTEVARLAHGIGMKVLATRGSRREGPPFVDYVGLADETLSLAPRADVVVNATPLTPRTVGLFDAEFFRAMKPGAYFLNVGRGRSVVTADLVEALETGHIAGAGLDVTDPEPLPKDHALWKLSGVIITPHVSARSDVRGARRELLFRENLRRFVAGERLLSVVDKQRGY